MDEMTLAKDVASYLTPYLPYLVEAGKLAVGSGAKKFGESAWEAATALWRKLWPVAEAKPALKEAIEDLGTTPEDEDAQAALRRQMRKLFAENPEFAESLAVLLSELKTSTVSSIASGDRSIAVGRDVSDSVIVTGDRNILQSNKLDDSSDK
jgi:hypothetical protein